METTFIILQAAPIDNYETKRFSGKSCYKGFMYQNWSNFQKS